MGRLTTHVLDTAQGKPAAGVRIGLFRVAGERQHVKTVVTNDDGRTGGPLLNEEEFALGAWELVFGVDDYFAASGLPVADPPFLDSITLRFTISSDTHYHLPLLVSPWSYSTYRGS